MNEQIKAIRAEIERRKKENLYDELPMTIGRYYEDRDLLAFIDSLPEEPDKSLEEAVENYIAPIENDEGLDYINFNGRDIKDAFIAGAEWQAEQNEKDLSEKIAAAYQLGLANKEEQMMKEWLKDRDGCFWDGVEEGKKAMEKQMMKDGNVILAEEDFDAEKEKSMKWGYNLCKEQMLKDAVEAEVFDFSSNSPQPYAHIALTPNKYHTGDKVRIIIVKEDER